MKKFLPPLFLMFINNRKHAYPNRICVIYRIICIFEENFKVA